MSAERNIEILPMIGDGGSAPRNRKTNFFGLIMGNWQMLAIGGGVFVIGIIILSVGISRVVGNNASSSATTVNALAAGYQLGNVWIGSAVETPLTGSVSFSQTGNGPVTISVNIQGLAPNTQHGFHIHDTSDISQGCGTSGHFNPYTSPHGAPQNSIGSRHVGDLGNIVSDSNGVVSATFQDTIISLQKGTTTSILGKAIMIHAGQDDYVTQPTGNAGPRLGCSLIQEVAPVTKAIAGGNGITWTGGTIQGSVTFTQVGTGPVVINIDVSGLPQGSHGFHIHAATDISAGCGTSGHFNPLGVLHGNRINPLNARHVGDLGNIVASASGTVLAEFEDNIISLQQVNASVVGLALMIHAGEDDYVTQPTGNAGPRLGCAIITPVS
jgi:superoxide dismutase, Cu-Zn family